MVRATARDHLTLPALKSQLWDCAEILRGSAVDRTDWKAYILPLLFFKRIHARSQTVSMAWTREARSRATTLLIRWISRGLYPTFSASETTTYGVASLHLDATML